MANVIITGDNAFLLQIKRVRAELRENLARARDVLDKRESLLMSELHNIETSYRGNIVAEQILELSLTKVQTVSTLRNHNREFLGVGVAQLDTRVRELEATLAKARYGMGTIELQWDGNLENILRETGSFQVKGAPAVIAKKVNPSPNDINSPLSHSVDHYEDNQESHGYVDVNLQTEPFDNFISPNIPTLNPEFETFHNVLEDNLENTTYLNSLIETLQYTIDEKSSTYPDLNSMIETLQYAIDKTSVNPNLNSLIKTVTDIMRDNISMYPDLDTQSISPDYLEINIQLETQNCIEDNTSLTNYFGYSQSQSAGNDFEENRFHTILDLNANTLEQPIDNNGGLCFPQHSNSVNESIEGSGNSPIDKNATSRFLEDTTSSTNLSKECNIDEHDPTQSLDNLDVTDESPISPKINMDPRTNDRLEYPLEDVEEFCDNQTCENSTNSLYESALHKFDASLLYTLDYTLATLAEEPNQDPPIYISSDNSGTKMIETDLYTHIELNDRKGFDLNIAISDLATTQNPDLNIPISLFDETQKCQVPTTMTSARRPVPLPEYYSEESEHESEKRQLVKKPVRPLKKRKCLYNGVKNRKCDMIGKKNEEDTLLEKGLRYRAPPFKREKYTPHNHVSQGYTKRSAKRRGQDPEYIPSEDTVDVSEEELSEYTVGVFKAEKQVLKPVIPKRKRKYHYGQKKRPRGNKNQKHMLKYYRNNKPTKILLYETSLGNTGKYTSHKNQGKSNILREKQRDCSYRKFRTPCSSDEDYISNSHTSLSNAYNSIPVSHKQGLTLQEHFNTPFLKKIKLPESQPDDNVVIKINGSSSATYSPAQGLRLMNVEILSEVFSKLECPSVACKIGRLQLLEYANKRGLQTTFVVFCSKCGHIVTRFCSSRHIHQSTEHSIGPNVNYRENSEVNVRAMLGVYTTSLTWKGFRKFARIMDLPTPTYSMYPSEQARFADIVLAEVDDSMRNWSTRISERDDSVPSIRPNCAEIAVSFDGSWKQRGHYSNVGFAAVIERKSKKVVDYELLNRSCVYCSKWTDSMIEDNRAKYEEWLVTHKPHCSANFHGTSLGMEAEAAMRLWNRSEDRGLVYKVFIGDGDGSGYNSVKRSGVYNGEVEIHKEECVGHLQKRLQKHLMKATKNTKNNSYVQHALEEHKADRVGHLFAIVVGQHVGKTPDEMNKGLWRMLAHISEIHTDCPPGKDSYCVYQKDLFRHQNDPTQPAPKTRKCYFSDIDLEKITEEFKVFASIDVCSHLTLGASQNINETLHSIIWGNCLKTKSASPLFVSISVALSVLCFNEGESALVGILIALGVKPSLNSINEFVTADEKRICKRKMKQSVKSKTTRLQRRIDSKKREKERRKQDKEAGRILYQAERFGVEVAGGSSCSKKCKTHTKQLATCESKSTSITGTIPANTDTTIPVNTDNTIPGITSDVFSNENSLQEVVSEEKDNVCLDLQEKPKSNKIEILKTLKNLNSRKRSRNPPTFEEFSNEFVVSERDCNSKGKENDNINVRLQNTVKSSNNIAKVKTLKKPKLLKRPRKVLAPKKKESFQKLVLSERDCTSSEESDGVCDECDSRIPSVLRTEEWSWIGCEKCEKWFHDSCIGIRLADYECRDFICSECA